MRLRINALAIALALLVVGSGWVGGKRSWLMAQDLTQKQKDQRCESMRRALLGKDGTGETAGLRYEADETRKGMAQLQGLWDTIRTLDAREMIDVWTKRDLGWIKQVKADPKHDPQALNLLQRDLDYWRRLYLRSIVSDKVELRAEEYPPRLQQAIAQDEKRLTELNRQIANQNHVADALKCQTYWASHPVVDASQSSGSSSNSGSTPGSLRIKVITTLSCSGADLQAQGLGNTTVEFFAGLDAANSPTTSVTTGADGTTDDSRPLKLNPGTYTVRVASKSGSLEWIRLHLASDPGGGNMRDWDPKIHGASVIVSPASNPNGPEEYQLGVRMVSPAACNQ